MQNRLKTFTNSKISVFDGACFRNLKKCSTQTTSTLLFESSGVSPTVRGQMNILANTGVRLLYRCFIIWVDFVNFWIFFYRVKLIYNLYNKFICFSETFLFCYAKISKLYLREFCQECARKNHPLTYGHVNFFVTAVIAFFSPKI